MNRYLMTPGPVPVSPEVSLAGARPLIAHRGGEYSELFLRVEGKLGRLLKSGGRTVIFPSSGTGALESLAANFTGPDIKALSVSCGVFGDRFREITALYGAEIVKLDVAPGEGVSPDSVASALAANQGCSVLLLTQNETSTGVFNHIDAIISALPRGQDRPLVLVDGVSSVGAMPCFPEEWGIDGLATASQKGLLTPPGLGLVWLSERGWRAISERKCQSYYFDLARQKKDLYKDVPENPYTPPVTLYYELDAALDAILTDGWFDLRRRAADALAAGLESLGFELFVKDAKFRSAGVTAFSHRDVPAISKALKRIGIDPAGGQGVLKGKIIRMSHYHDVRWPEISLVLGGLYSALGESRGASSDFMRAAFEKWEGD
ncbi:MAG: alanine--glyoxylate aminotransferase family protein [Synergistaceae bacterium]|nr:alanine--glyoxylate aminotransferase family protein [Synergistaceae bacterium]